MALSCVVCPTMPLFNSPALPDTIVPDFRLTTCASTSPARTTTSDRQRPRVVMPGLRAGREPRSWASRPRAPCAPGDPWVTVAAAVGLVASVAYSSFPLQWVVGSRLSVIRSYVSELSVAGQPGAWCSAWATRSAGRAWSSLAADLTASCGARSSARLTLSEGALACRSRTRCPPSGQWLNAPPPRAGRPDPTGKRRSDPRPRRLAQLGSRLDQRGSTWLHSASHWA